MTGKTENVRDDTIYVEYAAALAGNPVRAAELRPAVFADPRVTAMAAELAAWPGPMISSHRSASQLFHKLVFLADIGIDLEYPGMRELAERILDSADANCMPLLPMNIPKSFGGTGQDIRAWVLCDAPSTLYALRTMGCDDSRIDEAAAHLASLAEPFGFTCRASGVLGTWKGPGRRTEPCPYATLVATKLLALWGDRYGEHTEAGGRAVLDLWENSLTTHPYIFYMGTDFRKLKLPFVWYDILHCLEVLSRIDGLRTDPRLLGMMDIVEAARTPGGFIPGSVYMPFKGWDFAQKKVPSPWMTFCVDRIRARLQRLLP